MELNLNLKIKYFEFYWILFYPPKTVQASIDSNQNNHQSTSSLGGIEPLKLFFGKNSILKKNFVSIMFVLRFTDLKANDILITICDLAFEG